METKHGEVLTCHNGLPPIKSHDLLNKWSFEVTQRIKYISFLAHNKSNIYLSLQKTYEHPTNYYKLL